MGNKYKYNIKKHPRKTTYVAEKKVREHGDEWKWIVAREFSNSAEAHKYVDDLNKYEKAMERKRGQG